MPKFQKTLEQCHTHFDKWLYLLKNLGELDERPVKLKERIFKKLFGEAEIANYTRKQLAEYEESLKYYWDLNNVIDSARAEGEAKGKAEGKAEGELAKAKEIAKSLLDLLDDDTIAAKTGISRDEINILRHLPKI
jgi:predicted transposase/invertase (TIGR01784 family)